MYDRTGNYLIVAILIGMLLGVVSVAIFGEAMLPVKFLGAIFLNSLKMIVIPLLFCSMIVGIANLGDVRKLGRTGLKTMLYFLSTSSIAVIIGLVLVNIIQPGEGFSIVGASLPEAVQNRESYSFFSWLTNQIPSNIIGAAAETKVLPVIVFALFFGGVLTTIGAKGKPVIAFFEGINEAIMKIVHIIMLFAPIGIFGLVAGQLAAQGGMSGFTNVLAALGKYSLVVILGLLIHAVIILPMFLKLLGGKNPIEYLVGMSQALTTAFATASSSATLPVSMECVEEKNDIDKRSSSFVLPLGATINMDGTALYEAVAAMFIAQAYGIDLPILAQITIFATAVLASVGAAGIPEAGLVTMVLVLTAVGLPLEGIGLILAIDWFLDRCRTTVNVWGDSIGAAVIASTAEIGLVDRRKLKAPKTERFSRVRGLTRRKDSRGKRKTQDKTSDAARERISTQGRKGTGAQKDTSRRNTKTSKKPDRYGAPRTSRRDLKGSGKSSSGLREEYKPQKEAPKATAKAKPVKTDNRAASNGQKPVTGSSATKKQTFGRKRVRPPQNRKKTQNADTKKAIAETTRVEEVVDRKSDNKQQSTFEVPKFPATILDDLVAAENGQDIPEAGSDVGEKMGEQDKRMEKQDFIAKAASDDLPDDLASDQDLSSAEKKAKISDEDLGDKTSADDFSRLDQAVLGSSTASDDQHAESFVSRDKDSSAISSEAETPVSEPDVDSTPVIESDLKKSEPEPPAKEEVPVVSESLKEETSEAIEPPEMAVPEMQMEKSSSVDDDDHHDRDDSAKEEITTSEHLSEPEAKPAAAEKSDDAAEEASGAKDRSDEEASNDDDSKEESMKWGRPKRKKMSR